MNKEKRKTLKKTILMLQDVKNIIEQVIDEEQTNFDNLSEGLQQTERGQKMEENIANMEYSIDNIGDAIEFIEETIY